MNKFSIKRDDWQTFEKSNVAIALHVFYAKKEKNIYPAYVSKHNSNREKQVILLMIPNEEGSKAKSEGQRRRHHLAVKKLLELLRVITSKHNGNFYCLNCLDSFATEKNNLNHIKIYVKIKAFVM